MSASEPTSVAPSQRIGVPAAIAIGGVGALLAGYSYTKLGQTFPTVGGAVRFLVQGFGDGLLSGALNIFQYIGYVIALALYARGFAGYAVTFLPGTPPSWADDAFASAVLLLFTGVNFLGAAATGKAETVFVVI